MMAREGLIQADHCPVCSRPMPQKAERNGLKVQSEPWRVYWQGRQMAGVRPMSARFLFLLLSFGEVTHGAMNMLLNEDTDPRSARAHIHDLRSMLRLSRVPAEVQSIHGWGYRLQWRNP
jgi:DNA-binding response OmpR family regulator